MSCTKKQNILTNFSLCSHYAKRRKITTIALAVPSTRASPLFKTAKLAAPSSTRNHVGKSPSYLFQDKKKSQNKAPSTGKMTYLHKYNIDYLEADPTQPPSSTGKSNNYIKMDPFKNKLSLYLANNITRC